MVGLAVAGACLSAPTVSPAGLVMTSFSETPTWFEATYAFTPTPTPDFELNIG